MTLYAKHSNSKYVRPVALIILDGFGIDATSEANAIARAHTPTLDALFATGNTCLLDASGAAVGLPEGQMGNSEVGHLTIGSGRIVDQELTRITRVCNKGALLDQEALVHLLGHTHAHNSYLHIMGLVSDGGVHSHVSHLYALIDQMLSAGQEKIALHCFTDGRDVSPTSAVHFIDELEIFLADKRREYPKAELHIASLAGRYWAMDRDKRYERIQAAYEAIVEASHYQDDLSPLQYIEASYADGVTDEFIVPASFITRGVHNEDACLFFNFRPDRARQLTHAFVDEEFDVFDRAKLQNLAFAGFTCYEEGLDCLTVFPKVYPEHVLAKVLSDHRLRQYHIAETEKYAHVSFFFNGGKELRYPQEEWVLINSPKVATYDLQPEMSAFTVASTLSEAVRKRKSDVYICNFANCDMVGHTGSIPAAIKAVEAVDAALDQVLAALKDVHARVLITADHGNADKMIDAQGKPFTAHTTAQVPLIFMDYADERGSVPARTLAAEEGAHSRLSCKTYKRGESLESSGSLQDLAPTILDLLGIAPPKEMTGKSLLQKEAF